MKKTIISEEKAKFNINTSIASIDKNSRFILSNNSKIIRKLRKIHSDFNAKLFLPTKYAWTIGSYFIGKYIGPDNNTFTKDLLLEIAEELINEFKQFSVLVKYGKQIYFVPNKQVK